MIRVLASSLFFINMSWQESVLEILASPKESVCHMIRGLPWNICSIFPKLLCDLSKNCVENPVWSAGIHSCKLAMQLRSCSFLLNRWGTSCLVPTQVPALVYIFAQTSPPLVHHMARMMIIYLIRCLTFQCWLENWRLMIKVAIFWNRKRYGTAYFDLGGGLKSTQNFGLHFILLQKAFVY